MGCRVVAVLLVPVVSVVVYLLMTGVDPDITILCQLPHASLWLASCRDKIHESHNERGGSTSVTTEQLNVPEYSDNDVYNLCMLKSKEEEKQKKEGLRLHGFNEFVSERIGLIRDVPDVRLPACADKVYQAKLPKASVVMCFYNEAWSTLLRSVHSILRQTPAHLLHEIILLDDSSSLAHLGEPLEVYIAENFQNVKLVRSRERLGLIRARMEAARHTTGQVLVFLDSHIEAGKAWLEPLLDRIAKDRKTVVVPIVDTIEAETMVYNDAELVRGGFTWSLLHNWEPLPLNVRNTVKITADPFITPTMPGGLFAMDRDYFYELGEYDAGMDIWGGENMEISFRIWQCGGRLEIVPCSHVGHVFRQFRPYSSPKGEDTATRNAARVAEVWLGDYKKHFYDLRPGAKTMDFGDVSDRVNLKHRLKCRSFKWFLDNIHPEQIVPGEKPKVPGAQYRPMEKKDDVVVASGVLLHKPSDLCVEPKQEPPVKGTALILTDCHQTRHTFVLTGIHQVKLANTRLCLETADGKGKSTDVYLMKCHSSGGAQTWLPKYLQNGLQLFNPASGKCLSVPQPQEGSSELGMDLCARLTAQGFQVRESTGEL